MSTTISTSISEEDFRDQDEKLWNDLKREFESTPTMVFSVIGDSESFVPKLWQKDVFQTALVEAAKNGGDTWILYRGAKTGVSKVVRDAYKRCTEKKHNLVQLIDIEVKNDINISETNKRVTTNLLQFEEFVSQQEYSFKMPVPIAIIVCEGDIETIHHITKALKNKLPVIIIKGSGKAADFVLDALENSYMICENAKISLGIELNDSLQKMMKKSLNTIKKNMNLVGVFDLTQDDPLMLSNIVGKAVTNSWTQRDLYSNGLEDEILQTEENIEQFLECIENKSAMSRNRTRKPKHSSITSLPLWFYSGYMLLQKSRLMEEYGSELLLAALKTNQQDYIKLLLEEGVEIKEEYLPELYEQVTLLGKHNCTHIEWILKLYRNKQHRYQHTPFIDWLKLGDRNRQDWNLVASNINWMKPPML